MMTEKNDITPGRIRVTGFGPKDNPDSRRNCWTVPVDTVRARLVSEMTRLNGGALPLSEHTDEVLWRLLGP